MEKEIDISGAEARIEGMKVRLKGPKGELERDFFVPEMRGMVEIALDGGKIVVKALSERKKAKAMAGTIAAHIRNMLVGVTKGYRYTMKIHYVHFPLTVEVKGNMLIAKNFLGERGERRAKIADGVEVKVDGQTLTLTGISKEAVGQTASNIERAFGIKNKDRRVFQDGIYLAERMVME